MSWLVGIYIFYILYSDSSRYYRKGSIKNGWIHRLFVGVDQMLNTLIGGMPDETISSRAGKAVRSGVPSYHPACVLCWLLDKIDPDHCVKNIESDEGHEV